MNKKDPRVPDRRTAGRPADGEAMPCPECEIGTLRFDEHYSVPLASGGMAAIPSWICDDCQYGRPVRSSDQPPPLRSSRERTPTSNRTLLRARAALQRAGHRLSRTLSRKKR